MVDVTASSHGLYRLYISNVQQSLLSRRGQLDNLEVRDDCTGLTVDVVLKSMFGQIDDVRNQTSDERVFFKIVKS